MPMQLADCKVQSYESDTATLQARVPVRVLKSLEAEPEDMLRWFTDGEDVYVRVMSNE